MGVHGLDPGKIPPGELPLIRFPSHNANAHSGGRFRIQHKMSIHAIPGSRRLS